MTHVYFDAGRWAAVVYLSGPESAATGTEFFRHRDSRARRTSGARHTRLATPRRPSSTMRWLCSLQ